MKPYAIKLPVGTTTYCNNCKNEVEILYVTGDSSEDAVEAFLEGYGKCNECYFNIPVIDVNVRDVKHHNEIKNEL